MYNVDVHVCVFVAVTDLSTIPLLPPQDEEYARQLQSELYAMSDEPDRSDQTSAVSHISLMFYLLTYSLTPDFVLSSCPCPCMCSRCLTGLRRSLFFFEK